MIDQRLPLPFIENWDCKVISNPFSTHPFYISDHPILLFAIEDLAVLMLPISPDRLVVFIETSKVKFFTNSANYRDLGILNSLQVNTSNTYIITPDVLPEAEQVIVKDLMQGKGKSTYWRLEDGYRLKMLNFQECEELSFLSKAMD